MDELKTATGQLRVHQNDPEVWGDDDYELYAGDPYHPDVMVSVSNCDGPTAHRLAASWNACLHVPLEELEDV